MAQVVQREEPKITISQGRYDELIRTELKYNMLSNALEDETGYTDIDKIKKCFGIETRVSLNARKEIEK